MIRFRKNILLSLICIFLTLFSNSQEKFRPVQWSVKQGLAFGTAWCTLKDKNGFLWVGTQQGLSRFDGNLFKNYSPDPADPRAIRGEIIEGLKEDSLHNIWIGTDKGLTHYEIQADSFTNITSFLGTSIANSSVVPFWATKNELFCVESDSVITTIDVHSFSRKLVATLSHQYRNNYNISTRNTIFVESTSTIWMLADGNGGLLEISPGSGKKILHTWPCYKNIPQHGHWSEGMCLDKKRNCIWLNSEDGLLQFTLSDKQFHDVDPIKYNHKRGSSITMDNQGRIWVGTERNERMFVYTPETREVTYPVWGDSTVQIDVNTANSSFYCDRDNMIWITYYSFGSLSISQLVPFSPSAMRYGGEYSFSGWANAIQPLADGRALISYENTLTILDPQMKLSEVIKNNEIKNFRKNIHITFLGVDKGGQKAWFVDVEEGQPYEMKLSSRSCRPLQIFDTAGRKIPRINFVDLAIVPFKNGLLAGFKSGDGLQEGLCFINGDSQVVREAILFSTEKIRKIQPIDEHLVILTLKGSNKHLSFQLDNGKLVRYLNPTDSIASDNLICDSPDQSWWISRGKQLIRYDKDFHITAVFSISDGIPDDGNINGIISDSAGNIWFHTHSLISQLNVKTKKILTLGEKDGFDTQLYFPDYPIIKGENNDFYVTGGYDGLDRISPSQFALSYPPSFVYFKSLAVNQQPFALSSGINTLTTLQLTYRQNRINIETGVIDYYTKGSSRIRYKLEGVNEDWQYGPPNHSIRYEDLPSGDYQLVMQASNPVGEFNGPVKKLNIKITPPWWKTGWAYTLFAIAFSIVLWGFVQYRLKTLRAKNIQLEEKVMHRTKELKHSLEELRDTQTQLIQREKMASLGELTAGIAHEIQNPLNFVNNFSDLNEELIAEMKEEISQGNLEEVKIIANDLQINEKKINHHGKRADAIVKGMLQHSRTSTGIKEPTDMNALADEYLRLSYHGMRAKDKSFNSDIETQFDPDLRPINIIPQDIGRVLLNIYNNAFYAVHEKRKQLGNSFEPKVSVTTQFIAASNGTTPQAEIRIRDNGAGIPEKVLDKIFQPFFTTKPTGEGTGLGLSLSYDIVTKMHSGELKVESTDNQGAEFIIFLPAT